MEPLGEFTAHFPENPVLAFGLAVFVKIVVFKGI
jgi:hypothetical protein